MPNTKDNHDNNDSKPKWCFFGTDEFSVKVLATLAARGFVPSLIITVPDRPQGRKMILTPPLIKTWAAENKISCVQPTTLKQVLADNSPNPVYQDLSANYDFFLVASYGKIIPQAILDLPKYGTLNIHPSLLPKYRGATPLESVILAGEDKTGVTIIKLDAEMDHGPILAQEEIDLATWQPYYEELRDKLAELGANLLADNLSAYLSGTLKPEEQDHYLASFTKKITKENGLIDLNDQPEMIYRKIRALTPWPGVYFFIKRDNKDFRVIITKAHLDNGELIIDRVIPEGKKEISWEEFKQGYLKD